MIEVIAAAGKGLSFICQGKRVTEFQPVRVSLNHDVAVKLQQGSLSRYVKPVSPPPKFVAPEPVEEKSKKKKIYNKEL